MDQPHGRNEKEIWGKNTTRQACSVQALFRSQFNVD
jgi:hypothetical protein